MTYPQMPGPPQPGGDPNQPAQFPPPPQQPVQPGTQGSPMSGPPMGHQPGYPQQSPYQPYQAHGFQPQPTRNSPVATIAVVLLLVVIIAGGGVGAYFLFSGDDNEGSTVTQEPTESASEDGAETGGGQTTDPDFFESATFETPEDPWELQPGWSGSTPHMANADVHTIPAGEGWVAAIMTGVYHDSLYEYLPNNPEATVSEILRTFEVLNLGSISDVETDRIEFTDLEIQGQRALLAETTISWDKQDHIDDRYEQVAILLVDMGDGAAWVGLAAIPESLLDTYDGAVEHLLSIQLH
ncbi:hypothetical protein [Natronoglycomyces albus]|uniref:Uncharacterized protein n=1 Tax=Natronoglycomyces albus TaxID=2811108 RepID=A0A895XP80_9ACTN|nr:hypothetical protein [Natronoglycomyces albus]QSB05189.1 hypothetical protein JQS30_15755 [Natronoglycomyces albus]